MAAQIPDINIWITIYIIYSRINSFADTTGKPGQILCTELRLQNFFTFPYALDQPVLKYFPFINDHEIHRFPFSF